ncbi:MAG: acyl dehydratase [Gammaproteobacteria bacterium]|jgi:2-methylfumaryl-CoA hydratase|nr:acyl dehydratase [Gammaproteobacteria bacterium]
MMNVPYFEDFFVGQDFSDVPSVTVTEGMAALHQSLFGDRNRLTLDQPLCQAVTHEPKMLVNPALVCNLAIGQSTIPSQRVLGNLFYRGLQLLAPVFIQDTLTTQTQVVGLKQNTIKPGRAASGMVALEIQVKNQKGDTVLHFWRCPMIPCRNPDAETGHDDDFSVMPSEITDEQLLAHVPDWHFAAYRARYPSACEPLKTGQTLLVEAADTVTSAPELVRMTLNLAMTHTDATRSVYGKRLVYGGHTISIASKQLAMGLPHILQILAWYRCDHVGPVFEGDILSSQITIIETHPVQDATVAKLLVEVFAKRGPEAPSDLADAKVLDWSLAVLLP